MQSRNDIGLGKKVRAKWLHSSLWAVAAGQDFECAKQALTDEIAVENSGPEAIKKILTSLKRVWFTPPEYCAELHQAAVQLFQRAPSDRLAALLCWGMPLAAYPFVGSVAESLGRLFRLQGEAPRRDVERRIREQFGDRDFVARITRYNISSFLDWGIIEEAKRPGIYALSQTLKVNGPSEWRWVAEMILVTTGRSQISVSEFRAHPMLFPVQTTDFAAEGNRKHERLEFVRQGLHEEMIVLHEG